MNTWKVILATLVIYTAGIITGGLVVRHAKRAGPPPVARPPAFLGPEWIQQKFLERMKRELKLEPAQTARLEKIFRESGDRIRELTGLIAPEMQAELKEVEEKVRAELRPEQREKFEQLRKQQRRLRAGGGPTGEGFRPRDHRGPAPPKAPPRSGEPAVPPKQPTPPVP